MFKNKYLAFFINKHVNPLVTITWYAKHVHTLPSGQYAVTNLTLVCVCVDGQLFPYSGYCWPFDIITNFTATY